MFILDTSIRYGETHSNDVIETSGKLLRPSLAERNYFNDLTERAKTEDIALHLDRAFLRRHISNNFPQPNLDDLANSIHNHEVYDQMYHSRKFYRGTLREITTIEDYRNITNQFNALTDNDGISYIRVHDYARTALGRFLSANSTQLEIELSHPDYYNLGKFPSIMSVYYFLIFKGRFDEFRKISPRKATSLYGSLVNKVDKEDRNQDIDFCEVAEYLHWKRLKQVPEMFNLFIESEVPFELSYLITDQSGKEIYLKLALDKDNRYMQVLNNLRYKLQHNPKLVLQPPVFAKGVLDI